MDYNKNRRTEDTKKESGWRGSYTVEAAVIMSITVFVLGALILSAFYIHDRAVSQSMVCEAASVGSNQIRTSDASTASKAVRDHIGESRMLGSREISSSGSVDEKSSEASVSGRFPILGFAVRYLSDNEWSIRKSWSCQIPHPSAMIWKIRGISSLLSGGAD